MIPTRLAHFHEVWLVDTEFCASPGDRPAPVCLVARELRGGAEVRLWEDDLRRSASAPYPTDDGSLVVAYYASAELGVHLALGWPLPCRVLDPYAEFRCLTAGLGSPFGYSLPGALLYHGLDAMGASEKDAMRNLVLRGGPWSYKEKRDILEYCARDVDALGRLLAAMAPALDVPRALLRGRYVAAVARMEHAGVPIDSAYLGCLRAGWEGIRRKVVEAVDADYGVFDGASFKADRFDAYLRRQRIPWPRLPSGALALDDDTFREQARLRPAEIGPLREVRHALGQLRLNELAVGRDGRNRALLSPFASVTGRNQPSNSRFIFGPSCWLRSLIRPAAGLAVAYVDWSQQELAIAAALSGDEAMQHAYTSGDFYLTFAKLAGAAPEGATKESHTAARDQFKAASLGVLYGLTAEGLARKLGVPPCRGKELLGLHARSFKKFWAWSDAVEAEGMLTCRLQTVFGWAVRVGPGANPRSLRNFPMQANGAEMMRLACCLATERGVRVCAPVHDALLVEAPAGEIDDAVRLTQRCMEEAASVVLGGFVVRAEAKVVRHPDRYSDPRGRAMWDLVRGLLPPPPG